MPKDMALLRLEIPDAATVRDVNSLGLPANWRNDQAATQTLGMRWLTSGSSVGLWVPSFVEPAERNLLLNPAHPGYAGIQLFVEQNPFVFDPRLFA
jgi:RES domain-containing protein